MTHGDEDARKRRLWLTEALLEFTTIAGLFALMLALFVLCGAIQGAGT